MNEVELLKKRVSALEAELRAFRSSTTIPRKVELAFEARGFVELLSVESIDATAYDTLNKDFGGIPGLDFPIRWGKLTRTLGGNSNFIIPLYTLSDI